MFTSSNGGMDSHKRKMKEVDTEEQHESSHLNNNNLFNLQRQHQFSSPNVARVQQVLNTAGAAGSSRPSGSTYKPFSFMALLTAPDDELEDLSHSHQIDQIITHHSDNLNHVVGSMLNDYRRVTEERATKKLKEKEREMEMKLTMRNAHLQRALDYYKGESERLLVRVRFLERTEMSLRRSLEEANDARRAEMAEEESAESSFEDPDRVGPVILDCKVCHRQLATVMIWPCCHVCVCKGCVDGVRVCPVCRSLKTHSLEVCFPTD